MTQPFGLMCGHHHHHLHHEEYHHHQGHNAGAKSRSRLASLGFLRSCSAFFSLRFCFFFLAYTLEKRGLFPMLFVRGRSRDVTSCHANARPAKYAINLTHVSVCGHLAVSVCVRVLHKMEKRGRVKGKRTIPCQLCYKH